jgi:hypothetical protein
MARRHLIAAALLGALAPLTGCDVPESARGSKSLLALWSPPTPLEAAEMAVDPWDADNRARGTMLLANGYFGGEDPYHALYLERARDEDPNARAAGVRGLALHGQPEDVPLLVELLEDENTRVRLEATRALQRIYNPVAIDPLIVRTRLPVLPTPPTATSPGAPGSPGEAEAQIRAEAAIALGQYADVRVLVPLIAALDDRSLAVNRAARRSLGILTGQDRGLDRKEWLEWYSEADAPLAGRTDYEYPVFERDKFFWEHLPFVPAPPNETASTPVGFPPAIERQDLPARDSSG